MKFIADQIEERNWQELQEEFVSGGDLHKSMVLFFLLKEIITKLDERRTT